jgi:hypothetical protein
MVNNNLQNAVEALSDYLRLGFASRELIEKTAEEFDTDPKDLKEEFLKLLRKK